MEPHPINTGPYDADFDDPEADAWADDTTQDERTWGLIAHLAGFAGLVVPFGNLGGPLVVWLIKRDESAYVAAHAKEALNFQITMTISFVVAALLTIILIGIPILIALGIAWLVLPVLAAVRANEGEPYRYPFTTRLVT